MLLRVVHDAARNEADAHVHAALDALREDIAATRELVEKIADTKVFNNARHGKAADLRVRDLISDGMGLATALAMVAVASGQREAFEAAVKKLKEAAPSAAAATTSAQPAAPAESSSAAAEPVPPPAQPAPTEHRMREDPEGEALSQLTTQCSEGNRFLLGTDGTPVDLGQAFANFLQAAQGGYGPAQLQVGTMCEHGLGTAVDHRAALSWYRAAADQDLPEALLALGRVLSEGRCSVPRDVREAAQHLERAAELGSSEAMLFLGEQLLLDDEGSTVAAGLDWIDRASKAGNARAQCRLAEEHLSGARATKDPGSAFELLVLSAAQGHAPAITALGGMYERGEWVDENNERAGELYLKAVQAGHRAALLPFARTLLRSGENEHAKQILEDLGDSKCANSSDLLLLSTHPISASRQWRGSAASWRHVRKRTRRHWAKARDCLPALQQSRKTGIRACHHKGCKLCIQWRRGSATRRAGGSSALQHCSRARRCAGAGRAWYTLPRGNIASTVV